MCFSIKSAICKPIAEKLSYLLDVGNITGSFIQYVIKKVRNKSQRLYN